MKAILKFHFNGQESELAIDQGKTFDIGRGHNSQIPITDDRVSARHCQFLLKRDRLEIFDLDSKNGTYLNGIKIEQSEIFIGDEIKIGKTLITLEDSKMAPDLVDILTFPGPYKDRISYELKADFTSIRIQNQLLNKDDPGSVSIDNPYREKEVGIRKKARTEIKLSKKEIRSKNKFLSFVTTVMDAFLVFCSFCLPLTSLAKLISVDIPKEQQMLLTSGLMLASGIIFILLNFKATKFTLGERFSGIKDLYYKQ